MTFKQFFANDKLLHGSAGFVLTTAFTALFAAQPLRILYGIAFALLIGIGKEVIDRLRFTPKGTTPEEVAASKRAFLWDQITDLGWDIIGIVIACFCITAIIGAVTY